MPHLSAIVAYWRHLAAATVLTALAVGAVPLIVPESDAVVSQTSTAEATVTGLSGWDTTTWTSDGEPKSPAEPEPEADPEAPFAGEDADLDDAFTSPDEAATALNDPEGQNSHKADASRTSDEGSNPDTGHRGSAKNRTRAASKAADPIDPTNTPGNTPANHHEPAALARPQFPIAIGSWNTLGASHTEGNGCNRCHLPNSADRMPAAIRAIARHNLDVLGLQEFQPGQQNLFTAQMPAWKIYANADNAVAWNTHTFAFASASTITIPYFGGNPRQMPVVRLKHLRTGREIAVMSVHNPADVRGPARQWREQAVRAEADTANTLTAADVPVFLTGDMNDRAEFFCQIAAASTLVASAGGTRDATTCTPPARMDVDWILGSAAHVTFTSHTSDDGPDADYASDHPLVVATATVS